MKLQGCQGEYFDFCKADCEVNYIEEIDRIESWFILDHGCSVSNKDKIGCEGVIIFTYLIRLDLAEKHRSKCYNDCCSDCKSGVTKTFGF